LTFGDQQVGTKSASQTVTLSNTGSGQLTITSIAASGDFAATTDCGSTLDSGASCSIFVTFTPTAVGPLSGLITITDDGAGNPQTVPLNGNGVGVAAASVSPTNLTFPDQAVGTTSAPQ